MPKIYNNDKTVLEAAIERLEFIFANYEREEIFVSFSGGKDSTVLFYLALEAARKAGKLPLKVMTIDLEANYQGTINMMEHVLLSPEVEPYWICLPFGYRNALSMYEPYWVAWDPEKKEKWVKPMPRHKGVICSENNPFWEHGWRDHMRPSQFYSVFSRFIAATTGRSVALIGIRSDESLNRYRALFANKEKIFDHNWTTRLGRKGHMFNAYPIYDFRVEDIWGYQSLCGQPHNKVYDQMLLAGKTIHQMRICQPFGDEQKAGLDLYAKIEPDTWARIVDRCSAANMGSIYRGSKFLGVGSVALPEGFNWKTYYYYILTTLPPNLKEHYERMTGVTVANWIKKGKVRPIDGKTIKSWDDIDPDFGDCTPGAPSYKRFCKMILSGDFMGHALKFGGRKHEYTNFSAGVHQNRKKPANLETTQPNPLKEKYELI